MIRAGSLARSGALLAVWGGRVVGIMDCYWSERQAVESSYVFVALFLSEPQTVVCDTLKFRGTQFEKHCLDDTVSG